MFVAQAAPAQQPAVRVTGKVEDETGHPVAGVVVILRETTSKSTVQTATDSAGVFFLAAVAGDDAEITASAHGLKAQADIPAVRLAEQVELVLRPPSAVNGVGKMEFSDDPHFTVAGVTDWTAVGGHGSDSALRTSESLASTTAGLPNAAGSAGTAMAEELQLERELREDESQGHADRAQVRIHAALQRHPTATLYRLAAEVDEKNGNPLAAVREFEQAAKLESSETNEFEWGSELLVHRAIWQAEAVFQHGVTIYPTSMRMQTALGAALFGGARYEEAAERLCKASDLAPTEEAAYVFLGKVELAAPNALACVEPRLKRFVLLKPGSAEAHYLYAMALLKEQGSTPDAKSVQQAETLLKDAVHLDPKCSDGSFELGVLAGQREDFSVAIQYYTQAIAADPMMADAYYRLAKVYERMGKIDKAKAAFAMHDKVKQAQAVTAQQQRRAVKQFLFADTGDVPTAVTP
jgi:tetratricopeptide (TPR) repeat protein